MKINFNKWGSYNTPYLSLIINDDEWSIHFVVLNYHWWVGFDRKKK